MNGFPVCDNWAAAKSGRKGECGMDTFYASQARGSRVMIEGRVWDCGTEKEGNEHGGE